MLAKCFLLISFPRNKSKDTNYVIQTLMGDTVVIAPKYLKELNMLPESKLSSSAALVDSVMGRYNGVDLLLRDHLTSDICRGPLTRNIRKIITRKRMGARTSLKADIDRDVSSANDRRTSCGHGRTPWPEYS